MLVGIEKTFSYPYCHIFTTFDNYYEMKWQEKLTVVCNIIIKNFKSLIANNDWLQFGQMISDFPKISETFSYSIIKNCGWIYERKCPVLWSRRKVEKRAARIIMQKCKSKSQTDFASIKKPFCIQIILLASILPFFGKKQNKFMG